MLAHESVSLEGHSSESPLQDPDALAHVMHSSPFDRVRVKVEVEIEVILSKTTECAS